jgi:hypothetical protein
METLGKFILVEIVNGGDYGDDAVAPAISLTTSGGETPANVSVTATMSGGYIASVAVIYNSGYEGIYDAGLSIVVEGSAELSVSLHNDVHRCSMCEIGEYDDGTNTCVSCPEGKSTFQKGSTDISACDGCVPRVLREIDLLPELRTPNPLPPPPPSCLSGSGYSDIAGACEQCGVGMYSGGGWNVASDGGERRLSESGITAAVCRSCEPGKSTGDDTGFAQCSPCAADTYASSYGSAVCTACPEGSGTLGEEGSTSADECACTPPSVLVFVEAEASPPPPREEEDYADDSGGDYGGKRWLTGADGGQFECS